MIDTTKMLREHLIDRTRINNHEVSFDKNSKLISGDENQTFSNDNFMI
jgi:hypothetical protein